MAPESILLEMPRSVSAKSVVGVFGSIVILSTLDAPVTKLGVQLAPPFTDLKYWLPLGPVTVV